MHTSKRLNRIRKLFGLIFIGCLFVVYLSWAFVQPHWQIKVVNYLLHLPVPTGQLIKYPKEEVASQLPRELYGPINADLDVQIETRKAEVRQAKIDKVEALFTSYGSSLKGYGYIIVDEAERCGGDYSILIGIAGSESGLGRVNYKLYNPYGYLDGVQYASQPEALRILSCKVSEQHIAKCGQDLYCLARRYGGPETDLDHFVSKVAFFKHAVE